MGDIPFSVEEQEQVRIGNKLLEALPKLRPSVAAGIAMTDPEGCELLTEMLGRINEPDPAELRRGRPKKLTKAPVTWEAGSTS